MSLNARIVDCERCPRLREWCRSKAEEKRASFANDEYWGRPVPNFGDPEAQLLIVGLAPAAHGANRTGRMFTGDRSGDWLYRGLYDVGLANQAEATSINDGLTLKNVLITATVHCAPPDNKPSPDEIVNCRSYLAEVLDSKPWLGILCLGGVAWREVHRHMETRPFPKFSHGAQVKNVLGCYHPSQQNTFTGRLTRDMLEQQLRRLKDLLC